MPTGTTASTAVPQPVGYTRKGYDEMWGWYEVVQYSGRSDTATRQMRGEEPDVFPEPVCVVASGTGAVTPIYVASEIREFFDARPRRAHYLTEDDIRHIQGLYDGGNSMAKVAELTGVHINTVSKYVRATRV